MRRDLIPALLLLSFAAAPACALIAKSPALASPLRERLSHADTSRIEEAARTCFTQGGWTPDDATSDAEGATVVSAKNSEKARESVYIQAPGTKPRVTGDPPYDDPFWKCLGRELGGGGGGPKPADSDAPPEAPASSAEEK